MRKLLLLVVVFIGCEQQKPAPTAARVADLAQPPQDLATPPPPPDLALSPAGVLGMLKADDGKNLAKIFGRDSSLRSKDVLGGLVGTQIGEAYGTGKGGGGTGEGAFYPHNLGNIGRGAGGGPGSGYGIGTGGLRGSSSAAPTVREVTLVKSGPLGKEIVTRILRRHLNEARFCYEKELMRTPDLAGSIVVDFTTMPGGEVGASQVASTTMKSEEVGRCIAGAVKRWEFPKADAASHVSTTYTFTPVAP